MAEWSAPISLHADYPTMSRSVGLHAMIFSTTREVTIEPSTAVNCQPLESNQTFSDALNRVLGWHVLWDKEPQLSELNGDGVIIPAVRFGRIHYEWLARYLYLPLSTLNWYRNHVYYPKTERHNLYNQDNQ